MSPRLSHAPLRAVALLAVSLAAAGSVPALVAAATPAPGASAAAATPAASPAPMPSLTFAPLVTLPPIQIPTSAIADIPQTGYTLGDPNAPVRIEAWEDFQCPYCLRWTYQIEPQVIELLVKPGIASLTYRPLAFLGEESRWAAVAGDLAAEQGRFWQLHDLFFANQLGENKGSFGLDRILTMAQAAGLDMTAFTKGLELQAARDRFAMLDAVSERDATALGINATPSITVNGQLLAQPDLTSIENAAKAVMGLGGSPSAPAASAPAASASTAP